MSCEVKVGAGRSDLFEVSCGLGQGCILTPLLFSLFINSRLKEAEVGVKCGSKLISMLLYADDAVIFAEDEKSMRIWLDVLMGWCREWSVDEHGRCRRMVEERVKAGAVALSDWLRRCRASVGEVKGGHLGSCWKCLLARCFCMELKYEAVGGSLSQ